MSSPVIKRVIIRQPTSGQSADLSSPWENTDFISGVIRCSGSAVTQSGSPSTGTPNSYNTWPRAFFATTRLMRSHFGGPIALYATPQSQLLTPRLLDSLTQAFMSVQSSSHIGVSMAFRIGRSNEDAMQKQPKVLFVLRKPFIALSTHSYHGQAGWVRFSLKGPSKGHDLLSLQQDHHNERTPLSVSRRRNPQSAPFVHPISKTLTCRHHYFRSSASYYRTTRPALFVDI